MSSTFRMAQINSVFKLKKFLQRGDHRCELENFRPLESTETTHAEMFGGLDEEILRDRTCSILHRSSIDHVPERINARPHESMSQSSTKISTMVYSEGGCREQTDVSLDQIQSADQDETLWIAVIGVSDWSFWFSDFSSQCTDLWNRLRTINCSKVSVWDMAFIP